MTVPSKNIQDELISLCPKIKEICEPLFEILPIKLFRYVQSFKNGKKLILCSDEEWLKRYFSDGFYNQELANYHKHPDNSNGISIHGACDENNEICRFWRALGTSLNYSQVFCKYRKHTNYLELYDFAFCTDSHVKTNTALNNLRLINRFILYFEDKSSELINQATKSRFNCIAPKDFDFSQNWLLGETITNAQNSLHTINPERVYIDVNDRKYFLTLIESQCLKLISEGKKYKEIAATLGYSVRTIDDIVAQIKEKLNANSKAELILAIIQYNLNHKLDLITI